MITREDPLLEDMSRRQKSHLILLKWLYNQGRLSEWEKGEIDPVPIINCEETESGYRASLLRSIDFQSIISAIGLTEEDALDSLDLKIREQKENLAKRGNAISRHNKEITLPVIDIYLSWKDKQ